MRRLTKKEKTPWGSYIDLIAEKNKWHVKILIVKKNKRISLQYHFKREEFWVVLEGKVLVQNGKTKKILKSKDTIFIQKKAIHRITGITNSLILEITSGVHDEKDIVRISDDYNRK